MFHPAPARNARSYLHPGLGQAASSARLRRRVYTPGAIRYHEDGDSFHLFGDARSVATARFRTLDVALALFRCAYWVSELPGSVSQRYAATPPSYVESVTLSSTQFF